MKKLIVSIVFYLFLMSCNNNKATEKESKKDTVATTPVSPINSQKVTFVSATYYTGRVDFYFKDEKGAEVIVGINNDPEVKGAIYPPSLLESSENLEGPPGENPAMVGKQFLLIKNKTGDLIEIKAAN